MQHTPLHVLPNYQALRQFFYYFYITILLFGEVGGLILRGFFLNLLPDLEVEALSISRANTKSTRDFAHRLIRVGG